MSDDTRVNRNISIENAHILPGAWRNFSGKPTKFDAQGGKRTFCIELDQDLADQLSAEGWAVKVRPPRDEDGDPLYFLQVSVRFEPIPANVWLVSRHGKQLLDDQTIGMLDWAEIENVDIVIRPYNWENARGEHGVKAYVKTMYVTLSEDEFADKYADVQDDVPFSVSD